MKKGKDQNKQKQSLEGIGKNSLKYLKFQLPVKWLFINCNTLYRYKIEAIFIQELTMNAS